MNDLQQTGAAGTVAPERVIAVLFERDRASKALGMKVESVHAGRARVSMRVRPDMLNGHQTCHGGFIFSLADSAFAFACNSRNDSAVASACQISYLKPCYEGDVLSAEAVERALAGRIGIYDVSVLNQSGDLVAVFRGTSHRVRSEVTQAAKKAE